jgi:predicted lactoylglutathione lyase
MKSKKIWANFSVKDAKRTRQFYTQLGFTPNKPNNDPRLASFLFGDDDFVIHFFEQGSQIDEYLLPNSTNTSEIIFTLSADTEAEVKEWIDKVKDAGGTIFNEAGRDETNHYGFAFADPDGHKFNILLIEEGM